MISEDKKELLFNFLKLGMDFDDACLASGLTEDEQDIIEEDEDFLRLVKINVAVLEASLLTRLDKASKIAEKTGRTAALQWRLEKINPKKYSNKAKDDDKDFSGKLVINVIRGKKEDNE